MSDDLPFEDAVIVRITPDLAKSWLLLNARNRPLRRGHVTRLANQMKRGEWQLTGETIKFDTSGNLIDGQHRLAAVVESGCEIQCLVVHGLYGGAQDVIDTGRPRSVSDQLRLNGVDGAGELAGTARSSLALRFGTSTSQTGIGTLVTRNQLMEFCEKYQHELRVASLRGAQISKGLGLPRYWHAGLIYDYERVTGEAGALTTVLAYGADLDEGSPFLALRSWISRSHINRIRRSLSEYGHAVTSAIEARARKETRVTIRVSSPFRYFTDDLSDLDGIA
jgi:hypothetical protein